MLHAVRVEIIYIDYYILYTCPTIYTIYLSDHDAGPTRSQINKSTKILATELHRRTNYIHDR